MPKQWKKQGGLSWCVCTILIICDLFCRVLHYLLLPLRMVTVIIPIIRLFLRRIWVCCYTASHQTVFSSEDWCTWSWKCTVTSARAVHMKARQTLMSLHKCQLRNTGKNAITLSWLPELEYTLFWLDYRAVPRPRPLDPFFKDQSCMLIMERERKKKKKKKEEKMGGGGVESRRRGALPKGMCPPPKKKKKKTNNNNNQKSQNNAICMQKKKKKNLSHLYTSFTSWTAAKTSLWNEMCKCMDCHCGFRGALPS